MVQRTPPPLEQVLGSAASIGSSRIEGEGPDGQLPLTAEMLRAEPSGNIFGLTQNAGMGWRPDALGGPQYVIVSTMGGLRSEQGEAIALGYHTGHWEIGLLVRGAAEALRARGSHPVRGLLQRPVRRADAGHDRHVRQPGLSERCGHRHAASDPIAAHGLRCAWHRDL